MQSHQSDSNRRPMLYESIALPAELRWQRFWTTEGAAVKQRNRGSVKAVRPGVQRAVGNGQWAVVGENTVRCPLSTCVRTMLR